MKLKSSINLKYSIEINRSRREEPTEPQFDDFYEKIEEKLTYVRK